MRLVIQRVERASVTIGGELRSSIATGLMILVGIETGDSLDDVKWLAAKTAALRVFPDDAGVMNRSVIEAQGEAMAVSQFTLMASTRKGNRPSYIRAARPEEAIPLYEAYCRELSGLLGREVATGVFGADMQVELVNDGPVTIIIDSRLRE
ncbi:MAG: D-tyrosyl-tRNA(Tyr) deacylase [Bacteroidales bacterium]|nr:D-tyrosyl-tRNA(Tyr) deacylase [Bacteroidales bacterium]